MDTIFALASARGRAGVAVLRLSGPASHRTVERLTGRLPALRIAAVRNVRWNGELLDQGLVILFGKGSSYTGEASAELHLHGSVATVAAVLRALSDQEGLRVAEPGEFTRRALENGKLDLAQVEGLADLIDAETEAQRKQAVRVLSGAIGEKATQWRQDLIRASALLEATIDFADEDVPVDVSPEVISILDRLLLELTGEVGGSKIAERIRDGFEVAIIGEPNSGKSTLLNALAGREAALTSEFAGTTRDVIEVRMDLGGLPVTLLDTAGLRTTSDPVETMGIERGINRAQSADLRVFLLAMGELPDQVPLVAGDLVVFGKSDIWKGPGLGVSGKTGAGLSELTRLIGETLAARAVGSGTLIRERHRAAIERSIASLEFARAEVLRGASRAEIAAEEVRASIRALDTLVGGVDVENLLDEIFASFCIGK
jgi:tRNA modification GTPase